MKSDTPEQSAITASITVRTRTVALFLAGSAVALTATSYAMHLVTRAADIDTIAALDVGDEVSVSTWFQSLLFLAAAVVLLIGRSRAAASGTRTWGWSNLAAVMVLLSIDEAVSLHERAGSALRELLDTGGVLYYIWVLPALAFVALVSAVQFRWWTAFPSRTRMWLGLAAVIFVAGAAGLELAAGVGDEVDGTANMRSITFSAAEEFMEMVGLSVFVWAILDHLRGHVTELRVART